MRQREQANYRYTKDSKTKMTGQQKHYKIRAIEKMKKMLAAEPQKLVQVLAAHHSNITLPSIIMEVTKQQQ